VRVVVTLLENRYRLSVSRKQFFLPEVLMLPNVMEEGFVQGSEFVKPI
jgi:hypothetical protein